MLTPDLFPVAGLRLDDLVHSRYRRTVAGLPCHGRPVALRLVVRRLRCLDPGCPQAIFCERLPALLDAHARTTARLTSAHRALGFALGGEADNGDRIEQLALSPDGCRAVAVHNRSLRYQYDTPSSR